MGGGGQSGSTTTSTEPPAYLRPFLERGVTQLENEYNSHPAPDFYPGSTIAGFAPETQAALAMQTARAAQGSALTGAAQQQATDTFAGRYLDPTQNPNFQGAIAAAQRPVIDAFNSQVLPGIASQFGAAGRYGGGLMGDTMGRAASDLTRNLSDSATKAASDLYGNERQNQVLAMKYAPSLAHEDYFDINQLGTVGSIREGQTQAEIDADRERYNYDQTRDFNYISNYLGALQGAYPGGTSTSTSRQGGGGFQSALGGIMSFGGMLGSLFSDERVKDDIEPVGVAFGTGLPIYSYRYKWDGPDGPKHLGFMAQEVEKVRPEAVGEIGGVKTVNYDIATGGLFA